MFHRVSRWLAGIRLLPVHRIGLGRGGFFFILGAAMIGAAGMDADANLLMILFGLCCGSIVLSFFAGWRGLRGLRVERVAPETVVQGQPFEIRYTLANRRVWGCARGVQLQDISASRRRLTVAHAYVPVLRPAEQITLTVPAMATTRGRVHLSHLRVSTRFPFSIFTKSLILPRPQEIIAVPRLCRIASPIRQIHRAANSASSGVAMARARGDDEYYGIREYRSGDNPRRIHWRQSARTGQLMIREMSRYQDHRIWCVVHTRVDKGDAEQAERLERAISAAATVLCDALEQGARVGLICDGQPFSVMPPGAGRAYRPRLLRELALRAGSPQAELTDPLRRLTWPARWRGPCLLFAARVNDDLRAAADWLGRRAGPTLLLAPGTPAFETHFRFEDRPDSSVPRRRGLRSGSQGLAPVPGGMR